MQEADVTFTIASRLDAVPLLGTLVSALCREAGLPDPERNQVEVAVVEAVNNSIKHAYGQARGHVVELAVCRLPDRLIFDVLDSGKSADSGFMHADHRGALERGHRPGEPIPEGGRGLGLMQEFMDGLEYTPGAGRNRLRLIKRLPATKGKI